MDYCTQETNAEEFQRNLKQLETFVNTHPVITDEAAEMLYRLKLLVMTGSTVS